MFKMSLYTLYKKYQLQSRDQYNIYEKLCMKLAECHYDIFWGLKALCVKVPSVALAYKRMTVRRKFDHLSTCVSTNHRTTDQLKFQSGDFIDWMEKLRRTIVRSYTGATERTKMASLLETMINSTVPNFYPNCTCSHTRIGHGIKAMPAIWFFTA